MTSDVAIGTTERFERPGFVRLTASDRPGVAQPVPERDIPPQPWGRILLGALALFLLLMAGWEWYWRAFGATPGYRNSNGAWAEQRRRINEGEGGKTVLIGSSRILFDVQLPEWERATGERPIQLALEGTSAVPALEDLAADPDFTGRLVVDVTPGLFFSGFAYRGEAISHYHKQGPSQRSGHWLSKRLLEPYFAFYDPDFALATVIRRQDWPPRPGLRKDTRVRKLMTQDSGDRNTHIWRKVEVDPQYRALARSIWAENFTGPPPPMMDTPEKARKLMETQIERAVKAIATLRARGVRVVFVRPPSDGEYYAFEQKTTPRARTWDVLLQRTGTPGIHFEDYPQLQGYELPEWSHLTAADAKRFTTALAPLVEQEFARAEPGSRVAAAR
ncbi:hypothetical protein [Pseudoxanthomonas sacheonensis]|uniref:SGNH/GDSL hydrolase family protein n=1 Tax=Pseudoxanthomonas sacheonensis TaxID=443615 RepID=A0ABU1RSF2_9GAMM|nr:hypothetical protein [Pseudoxanthomonas sacheonensis]MDR6841706.1 hypothetical protein [Pseudoxanthomonas sacheonensis]